VAERSGQASSAPILPQPEAEHSLIGMAAMLREAWVASGPPEAWPVVAPVRPSVRPEAQGALRVAAVPRTAAEWPLVGSHAGEAAWPAAEQQEVAAPWAVPPEEAELRAGMARWAAALDALAGQPSEAQLSAVRLSVFLRVRYRPVMQPARVGPARIARAMASPSTTRR
jgi:hypothetical protein